MSEKSRARVAVVGCGVCAVGCTELHVPAMAPAGDEMSPVEIVRHETHGEHETVPLEMLTRMQTATAGSSTTTMARYDSAGGQANVGAYFAAPDDPFRRV